MLVACKSKVEIDCLKLQLNREFEMKDLGEAKKILGMEIAMDRVTRTVHLTYKAYLKKVLKGFGMEGNSKLVTTPLAPPFKLSASLSSSTKKECDYMPQVPYSSLIGSLMYAMGLHYA